MEIEEIKKWLNKHKWTFAKTMKEMPHEYIVKDKLNDEDKEMFVKVVIFIREKVTNKSSIIKNTLIMN